MSREKLITDINHMALLRYEMYAEQQGLSGCDRGDFLTRKMAQITFDLKGCTEVSALQSYYRHQKFLYDRAVASSKEDLSNDHTIRVQVPQCDYAWLMKMGCNVM